jgi:hypothetical protein
VIALDRHGKKKPRRIGIMMTLEDTDLAIASYDRREGSHHSFQDFLTCAAMTACSLRRGSVIKSTSWPPFVKEAGTAL